MSNILQNIEAIRKKKGIKQAVIAEALGVKQPAYSNYITRNDDIYFNRLSQIANVLNISVIDIIIYPDVYKKNEDSSVSEPQAQYGKSTTDEINFLRKIIENQQKELDNKQKIIENQQKELDNKQRIIDKQLNTIEAYEKGKIINVSDADARAPKKGVG
ncbi:MAG: helix-turn-helix transcriptional regulator [Prevotella sp.]|jgi:transcriptional regulator with XRE-family HTH domain|nr:helix-turn-helix transcriptional regulator [Prevotella sp.]